MASLINSPIHTAGPTRVWPALSVHECFEILADRQPQAPAVILGDGTLTYAELDQKANALAHALLARELSAEEPVGVLTERSGSLPIAFLAILKAGGAYVPMGADLPAQRLANMAAQSSMRCLIALDGLEPPAELVGALGASPPFSRREKRTAKSNGPTRQGKQPDLFAILFGPGAQPKG